LTYCIGILLNEGLVLASDSRTNAGIDRVSTFRKMHVLEKRGERFFALLTEKQIRRGVHPSTRALEADIHAYIDAHNAEPRPFRWTKSADDILAAINRFCLRTLQIQEGGLPRTSESGH